LTTLIATALSSHSTRFKLLWIVVQQICNRSEQVEFELQCS